MSIGKEFIEKTKHKHLGMSEEEKGVPRPSLELDYDKSKPIIDLPKPDDIKFKDITVRECIEKRRSFRDFSGNPISIKELSYLLWCTQGVKKVVNGKGTVRTVPSAGAMHPFETFIMVQHVEGLKPGFYRFLALEHKLVEQNLSHGINAKIRKACGEQEMLKTCSALFIWAAVAERATWRYVERAYRYFFLDAGHICQNLYLSSESIGLGACAVGAFDDDELNKLLGFDGEKQFVVYAGAVGKK
jgi:SagB-type dehydrogenase family enzyme